MPSGHAVYISENIVTARESGLTEQCFIASVKLHHAKSKANKACSESFGING